MSTVRLALAQLNCRVGDLAGNAARVRAAAQAARAQGADVLLAPELALTGYPPLDLLLQPFFLARAEATLGELRAALAELTGLHVIVGHPWRQAGRLHNAVSVLKNGTVLATYCKRELPNYTVFNETRYFAPGDKPCVLSVRGVRLGLAICEDMWLPHTAQAAVQSGAQALLVANASPWSLGKGAARMQRMTERVQDAGVPLLYSNLVGGQDELVFDGASFALDAQGAVVTRLPAFTEGLALVDVHADGKVSALASTPAPPEAETGEEAEVWAALTLALRDYLAQNGFAGAIIGLSGGMDSALVLALAVDALGAARVRTVMMASPYTAEMSLTDARAMAANLGVRHEELPIAPLMAAFDAALAAPFAGLAADTTEENLQARIRGTLLMALSNKTGWLVLSTGNKSELATGYCTLYGDMAGGFAVLKDVPKTLVYRLARWRNRQAGDPGGIIPTRIIARPASAELAANQTDQDSLPPYEVLDAIIERAVEHGQSAAQIVAAGLPAEAVAQVLRLLRVNEYKRQQAPVGPRVTRRAFGSDWRMPISNSFRDAPD